MTASRRVSMLLAMTALAGAACGTSSPASGHSTSVKSSEPSTSTSHGPETTTKGRSLSTPSTLANGAFPSVLDPRTDGSLGKVRVSLTTVANVDTPTALVPRPGHPDELFLAERAGKILLVTLQGSKGAFVVHREPIIDLSARISTDGEKGLLDLAFDRAGDTLYASYNVHNGDSRIVSWHITDSGGSPKLSSGTVLLRVDQMGTNFHKGGSLAVDANDLLYAGFGDGGPQDDAKHHAQNPSLLLGKILRIDPKHPADGRPYGIPDTNPYAHDHKGRPEIYLTGLRNPWRIWIDDANGDLWIGDVGQNDLEEVDRLPAGVISAGANLGWSGYEGTSVFRRDRIAGVTVPPIYETAHRDGNCSITGGVVYRGTTIAGLNGAYLFSDLCHGGVVALRSTTPADGIGRVTDVRRLPDTQAATQIISFGTDARGTVYLLSLDGSIKRIDAAR